MDQFPLRFKLGAATVTVIDLYSIPSKLDELIVRPAEAAPLSAPIGNADLPVQCILVQTPGSTILVDAGAYEAAHDHSDRAGYQPPPDLIARLAEAGVAPEDVDHVAITHLHGDHYNALATERDGRRQPTFPNATYHVGAPDWEAPALREALANPASLESLHLAVANAHGRLNPTAARADLGNGVTILASPGETPGHQTVRVESEGETLYCVGDLYHHPLEVEHPDWMAPWADRAANVASRRALADAALAENARVIATHIPGVGRLRRSGNGVTWASD